MVLPTTGVCERGATAVGPGARVSIVGGTGGVDGGARFDDVGPAIAVGAISDTSSALVGAEGVIATGLDVECATAIGAVVVSFGWIGVPGGVAEDVGSGDGSTVAAGGVDTETHGTAA